MSSTITLLKLQALMKTEAMLNAFREVMGYDFVDKDLATNSVQLLGCYVKLFYYQYNVGHYELSQDALTFFNEFGQLYMSIVLETKGEQK